MKKVPPSDNTVNELMRYTKNLMSFFDSGASVKISTTGIARINIEIHTHTSVFDSQENLEAFSVLINHWFNINLKISDKEVLVNIEMKNLLN